MRVVRRRATHVAYILLSRTKCRSVVDEDKRDLVETLSSHLDSPTCARHETISYRPHCGSMFARSRPSTDVAPHSHDDVRTSRPSRKQPFT